MKVSSKILLISTSAFVICTGIGARTGISNNLSTAERLIDKPASTVQLAFKEHSLLSSLYSNNITEMEEIQEPVTDIETILNNHLKGKLAGKGDSFARYGREYRVDPALLAAIAIHETGNGTSKAINNLNNAGGIMQNPARGILRQFISVNASIEYMAWLLRNSYMDARNLHTIEQIGNRYCPVGADYDKKTNLNQHWIPAVTRIYREIVGVDYE